MVNYSRKIQFKIVFGSGRERKTIFKLKMKVPSKLTLITSLIWGILDVVQFGGLKGKIAGVLNGL